MGDKAEGGGEIWVGSVVAKEDDDDDDNDDEVVHVVVLVHTVPGIVEDDDELEHVPVATKNVEALKAAEEDDDDDDDDDEDEVCEVGFSPSPRCYKECQLVAPRISTTSHQP